MKYREKKVNRFLAMHLLRQLNIYHFWLSCTVLTDTNTLNPYNAVPVNGHLQGCPLLEYGSSTM